jgi:hypothetical protein
VNYREPDRLLGIKCAEKHATTRDNRPAELDLGSDAMRT